MKAFTIDSERNITAYASQQEAACAQGDATKPPQVSGRMQEAWNRAVINEYLMHNLDQPHPDFFVITSTGEELLERSKQGTLPSITVTQMLPREALHSKISDKSWPAFMRGEFDVAVLQAMKTVEVSVREASGLDSLIGVKLMREAFRDNGPLGDMSVDTGERGGRMELFAGAIGPRQLAQSGRDLFFHRAAKSPHAERLHQLGPTGGTPPRLPIPLGSNRETLRMEVHQSRSRDPPRQAVGPRKGCCLNGPKYVSELLNRST
jgi:hypothetical protein